MGFSMMTDQFFAYDASIAVPLSTIPVWPYTLHYRRPHKCPGNNQNCPSKSHPVWELPINELDRREDPDFDEFLTGCHLVSSCSSIYHKDQLRCAGSASLPVTQCLSSHHSGTTSRNSSSSYLS